MEHEDQSDISLLKFEDVIEQDKESGSSDEEYEVRGNADLLDKFKYRLTSKSAIPVPHHTALLLNTHENNVNLDNIEDLYLPLTYNSSYPIPFNSVFENKKFDPSMQLVSEKKSWHIKVANYKTRFKKLPKYRKFDSIKPKKSAMTVPLYLYNFAKLLHDDPDVYFDSSYNWYYVGNGNLCNFQINNVKYMAYSSSSTLYVQKYSDAFKNQYECMYSVVNKQLIYETIFSTLYDTVIIGLRQKFRIYLLQLVKTDDNFHLENFKTIKSDIPFLSFCIDSCINCVYYSCANDSVYLYDLTSEDLSELPAIGQKNEFPNNWSSVQHLTESVLLYTNQNSINAFDKRMNETKNVIVNLTKCEKISSSKVSLYNSNNVYLSSTHNILLYDLRYVDKRNGFQKQWSHGLECMPIFMCHTLSNREELILISGQSSRESCFIVNSLQSFDIKPDSFDLYQLTYPWHPPSIYDSCKKAFLKGICLDPTLCVKERMKMSRCGSIFVTQENVLNLFTLNSVGDIFYQEFSEYYNAYEKENDFCNSFLQWSEYLLTKIEKNKFIASSVIDTTEYCNKMKRNYPRKIYENPAIKPLTSNSFWKNSIQLFSKCTDMCAQELLDMWGLKEDIEEIQPTTAISTIKVNTWMNTFE